MSLTYPYKNFRYTVEIDGINAGGFSEVSGVDISVDVIEYREGNEKRTTPRKLTGLTKYGNVTLKWGSVGDMAMLDWINSVASSNEEGPKGIQRKKITIKLLDENGNEGGPSWEIINAWPTHYTAPDLNGTGGEVAIESLEICHEGVIRMGGSSSNSADPPQN